MKLNPSRFSVRQPPADFTPPSRARDFWLAAAAVAIVLLGAVVEGMKL